MIQRVAREEAEQVPLPGRVWHSYFSPTEGISQLVSLGVSVFEPGARPIGHIHPAEEETIYCIAGRGRIVTPDAVADMEPGVVVHVEPNTFHATEADEDGLELLCLFSPPVVSGSYEKKDAS